MSARKKVFGAVLAAIAVAVPVSAVSAHVKHGRHVTRARTAASGSTIKHVLLLSVDGLHQSDLSWYVQQHPDSNLAGLVKGSADYSNARTPIPSDSFPGMVGQVTGGNPSTTGIYYDDTFNHNVYPSVAQSQPSCSGLSTGAEVTYFEQLALNPLSIDSGYGLPGLPGHPFTNDGIMQLPSDPTTALIDPNQLPRDVSCNPIYPHSYLQANTVFGVLHNHGLLTAWSDKHAAYEVLNGPQGHTIDDLFTPEINANAFKPDGSEWTVNGSQVDYTGDNAATMQYDDYKVQAVLNELNGWNHSHTRHPGVPAILGMNFQTVSTAEKLPKSDNLDGGYLVSGDGSIVPGPLLARALNYVNDRVGIMMQAIGRNQGLAKSTAIILSAKHGQSPRDPREMLRIDDGPIMDYINGLWASQYPGRPQPLILGGTDDDALMWWLNDRSQFAADFVTSHLMGHDVSGNALDCSTPGCSDKTAYHPVNNIPNSGLVSVSGGKAAAAFFGVPWPDPLGRVPDIIGVVQEGVVYTGGHKKIAEHGGANPGDLDVPIVVYAPGHVVPGQYGTQVETTQIAPAILQLLGFSPYELQAVQQEGSPVLPGVS